MKISDTVRRSARNLRSSKIRTLLTALAIAVGAFTLSLTLAAGNGLRTYTDELVKSNFDPAELLAGRDAEIANNGTPSQTPKEYDESVGSINVGGNSSLQVKRVSDEDVAELKKLPYVEQVRENLQLSIRYVTREGQKKYTGSAEAYNPAQKPQTDAGTLPATGDIATGTVLLPESYVSSLGFKDAQDAIGKSVQINAQQPFSAASVQAVLSGGPTSVQAAETALQPKDKLFTYTVAAITKTSATSLTFGVQPLRLSSADAKAIYDYTVGGTADYGKYLYVSVRVRDGTDEAKLDSAQADLVSKGYYVQSVKDVQKSITTFVNVLQIMVGVFGIITIIASVFGIVNTQYISVLERTREIGLMKALGMNRRSVNRLFMLEATWIGFLGGILGVAMGYVTGLLLNPVISKKLDLGDGKSLLMFEVWQLAVLILALMVIATVAGWLPARKAAKLDPIVALRTE